MEREIKVDKDGDLFSNHKEIICPIRSFGSEVRGCNNRCALYIEARRGAEFNVVCEYSETVIGQRKVGQ